jgi:autotransporter-associated beta strand protein
VKRRHATLAGVSLTAGLAAVMPTTTATAGLSEPPPPIQTYVGDPGQLGDPASWRTPEFLRDNGMVTIGAEYAYAAGYSGTGMNIGMVDSGTFAGHMREHGSLATGYAIGDRFHSVVAQGGQTGPTSGFFNQEYNDSHGTHVSGTIAASRDGVGETQPDGPQANMHGVAFNADLYAGNTHKTDGVFYGLVPENATPAQTPDNGYIGNVYRAVNNADTANGKPIRLITTSWGSAPPTENYNTYDPPPGGPASFGLNAAWRYISTPDGVADANGNTLHWLNGAIEVARTGTILQFTAGNAGARNPTARGAAPYFLPDLEGQWYTTSGVNPNIGRTFNPDGSVRVPGTQEFNQCGLAKWSCLTAPSRAINSTWVDVIDGVPQARYRSASGTSMAGPHSAAALSLIMQRFPYMTNEQALYTMFTTGRQNATISDAQGNAVPNPYAGQIVQVPDSRNGWGTVSLREAMQGPGQLVGPTDINTKGFNDVWANDISDVAIQARQGEDAAEDAAWEQTKIEKGWTNGLPPGASDIDRSDFAIGTRRDQARNERVYEGSLTKRGGGTLFLAGDNTWHGTSTVRSGKLSVVGSHASPIEVQGGTLGGNGSVGDSVDVSGGVLAPGLSSDEADQITEVPVTAGNTLTVDGDVSVGKKGRYAVTISGDDDNTNVVAGGDLNLAGDLAVDVQGDLTQGTTFTIMSGQAIHGTFRGLAEGAVVSSHGYKFTVSYASNSVTLTVA